MWNFGGTVALTAAVIVLASAGAASAETLGSTVVPTGAGGMACENDFLVFQVASDSSTPYTVPSDGTITAWQTNTSQDTAGTDVSLAVVRPQTNGNVELVALDNETLPATLPTSGVASFTLTTPIDVDAGDEIGLYSDASSDAPICYWSGGDTSESDVIDGVDLSAAPSTGTTYTPIGDSPTGYTMNVAVTFVSPEDVAVTTAAGQGAVAGQQTVLDSTVTDKGPGSNAITFRDAVPSGLKIDSVVAGDGTCSVSGQAVTCTVSGLASGQSAPLDVVVTPASKGSYVNKVAVAPSAGVTDPDEANNSASATLSVAAAPAAPKCTVPSLKGVPEKTAEKVLKLLGCTVGKVKKEHSSSVPKGSVIKTSPKAGTYADKKKVSLTVSSGKEPKHKKKKK